MKLGPGNLRLIGERLGRPQHPHTDVREMAKDLVDALPAQTVPCLKEFQRNRIPEIEDIFTAEFGGDVSGLEAELANLSRRSEALKVFTKLVLLFHRDRGALTKVFYLALWRSRPTAFDYAVEDRLPGKFESLLISQLPKLAKAVSAAISDRSVELLGHHRLDDGTLVIALNREYTPAIKRDFVKKFTLHYLCGVVVLGVNPAKRTIDVRCSNARVGEAVHDWFKSTFDLKLRLLRDDVCSDYDPVATVSAFLGEYERGTGVELLSIRFRRTSLPGQPSLALTAKPYSTSLREDVARLREAHLVHAESLTDIETVRVSYDTKEAEIGFETDRGGALCLRFNNAGWDEALEGRFKATFQRTFGVPLNKRIDPTKMAAGVIGVIQYLLSIQNEGDVQPFQAKTFQELAERGLLVRRVEPVRQCRNATCTKFEKRAGDQTRAECEQCGKPLSDAMIRRVVVDPKRVLEVVRDLFAAANSWSVGKEARQFEKAPFHPLRSPAGVTPRSEICVFVRDELSDGVRKKFVRSARPLLLVKTRTDGRHAYLDDKRMGVLSLPYLLAAETDPALAQSRPSLVCGLVDDLARTSLQRMVAAAEQSFDVLRHLPPGRKGYEYETDIFNLLKAVFPETIMLGAEGVDEPDGYCALPYYEKWSLRDGRAWCFTYDAKLSYAQKGYELDIDERRKMVSYINKFRASRLLRSINKMVRAHVIISNNMAEGEIKSAYDYLMGENGLKKSNKEVKLVLMRQEFVVRLYERRRSKEDEFARREALLAECVIRRLDTEGLNPEGYVVLTDHDADRLADKVLAEDPQYEVVDGERLAAGDHA
ncbi:MAG: hypothetical protein U0804_12515 [Gemmataceae bacterium]